MEEVIDDFRGKYRYLSNFHVCNVELDDVMYPSTEHAYQAAKSEDFGYRASILKCPKPSDSKRLSQEPWAKLLQRPDWFNISLPTMLSLLRQKFSRYPELRDQLLATGNAKLIEGNVWHDEFWGVCHCGKCPGKGQNNLGKQLMQVRAELKLARELQDIWSDSL